MTYFHGTSSEIDFDQVNPTRDRFDICLTDDRSVAEGYADQKRGDRVYEVSLNQYAVRLEYLADDFQQFTDIELDGPYAYLALDDVGFQERLVDEGYCIIEYEDEDWDNIPHTCVRVLAPGLISVN